MKKINMSVNFLKNYLLEFEKLSNTRRLIIYIGTILILIGMVVFFDFLPKLSQIKELNAQYKQVQTSLSIVKSKGSMLNKKQEEFKKAEAMFNSAAKMFPDKKELPGLLTSISESGKKAGLEFLLFEPKQEITNDFYTEIPVFISVRGNYHNVGVFFDHVSNLSRIVNIQEIKIVPEQATNKLITNCKTVTYKFTEKHGNQS